MKNKNFAFYYISKCCDSQVRLNEAVCDTCLMPCEVTAILDSPVGVPTDLQEYERGYEQGKLDGVPEEKPVSTCICGKCKQLTLAETRSAIMAMALDKTLGLDDVTVAKILNHLK